MDSSKLAVKVFVNDASAFKVDEVIPVFHEWIQARALKDHLLIDVVDYAHVPEGPGVVLIAHEANLALDEEGRLGLYYQRKHPIPGDLTQRLRVTFAAALTACRLLEENLALAGRLSFATDDLLVRVVDRLHAPNTPEAMAYVRPVLQGFLERLYGGPVTLEQNPDPKSVFEVRAKAGQSLAAATLLDRLATL